MRVDADAGSERADGVGDGARRSGREASRRSCRRGRASRRPRRRRPAGRRARSPGSRGSRRRSAPRRRRPRGRSPSGTRPSRRPSPGSPRASSAARRRRGSPRPSRRARRSASRRRAAAGAGVVLGPDAAWRVLPNALSRARCSRFLAHGDEELRVLRVRARPAALDVVDAELVQPARDRELVVERQRDAGALAAVAQRRVVDRDAIGHRGSSVGDKTYVPPAPEARRSVRRNSNHVPSSRVGAQEWTKGIPSGTCASSPPWRPPPPAAWCSSRSHLLRPPPPPARSRARPSPCRCPLRTTRRRSPSAPAPTSAGSCSEPQRAASRRTFATTTNTDTIVINGNTGAEPVTLDLSGGAFAPGLTVEGAGTSEIEIAIDLGNGVLDRLDDHGRFRQRERSPSARSAPT